MWLQITFGTDCFHASNPHFSRSFTLSQELSALRGMRAQIQSDRPIFTVEVHVHFKPEFTRDLIRFIHQMGFDTYLIEEPCGASWHARAWRVVARTRAPCCQDSMHSTAQNISCDHAL